MGSSMNTQAGLATCRAASRNGATERCACCSEVAACQHAAMPKPPDMSMYQHDGHTSSSRHEQVDWQSTQKRPCSTMKLRAGRVPHQLHSNGQPLALLLQPGTKCWWACHHAGHQRRCNVHSQAGSQRYPDPHSLIEALLPETSATGNSTQYTRMSPSGTHHRQPSHACQPNQCILQRSELN